MTKIKHKKTTRKFLQSQHLNGWKKEHKKWGSKESEGALEIVEIRSGLEEIGGIRALVCWRVIKAPTTVDRKAASVPVFCFWLHGCFWWERYVFMRLVGTKKENITRACSSLESIRCGLISVGPTPYVFPDGGGRRVEKSRDPLLACEPSISIPSAGMRVRGIILRISC